MTKENLSLQEIKEFIEERKHWKKGPEYWADYLGEDINRIHVALDTRKEKEEYKSFNLNKDEEYENEYQAFLQKNGIEEEDVVQVYYKEKAGGVRFTVQTRHKEEVEDEDILEAISKAVPKSIIVPGEFKISNNAAIINLYDAHFDKISQIGEGHTIDDNIKIIREAFLKLLTQIDYYKPEVVYFPIGNDFFNTNDFRMTTKRGTEQQDSVHWKESFQYGITLIRELIDSIVSLGSIVVIPPIEGNHDADKTFYLNEVIKVAYEDIEEVITQDVSQPRMYFKYGYNMLGFGHGYNEKRKVNELPLIAAEEAPEMWGSTKYREMFLGDIHHKEEYRFLRRIDKKGFTVNFLRDITLNHSDWDRNNSYHVGTKTIEAHIFDKNKGQIANLKINI